MRLLAFHILKERPLELEREIAFWAFVKIYFHQGLFQ
ncbi:hypothetical protein SGRA_1673 [Saprospira grandis str. Lewin]|uniref:Uncharacterized protein n=1 Tax=Saprospira grandis (strain Lewin) TaxID=984262 RepID=H6LAC3_SAPGL|nr:hypothetical protein SGRA_1673 [Saprospira grandis str. Lewin]